MERVIGFLNGFSPIIQTAIAQQKDVAAQRQILLVIARNAIRNKNATCAVELSVPALAGHPRAQLHGAVDFGVGIRLSAPSIPTPAAENTEPIIEWLFEVCAEAVLQGGAQRVGRYFRDGGATCKKAVDGFAVTSHVGMIHVGK